MNRVIMSFASILLVCFSSLSSPLDEAVAAYDRDDYTLCIEKYEEIIKEKGTSASLLFNLGNAYVKSGDFGKGMLCYERARLLDPGDKAIKENIAYLKGKVDDNNRAEAKGKKISVTPEDKSFSANVKQFVVYSYLPDTWALWAGIAFVLTCGCVALYIFSSNVLVKKIGFFGGIIALIVSIVTLIFALVSASDRSHSERGVIVGHKVLLHSEPFQSSKPSIFPLTRGTVMNVLERDSASEEGVTWYKVRLNSDFSGWIKSENFELI